MFDFGIVAVSWPTDDPTNQWTLFRNGYLDRAVLCRWEQPRRRRWWPW